ncbi:hypothetical protein DT076_00030 [Desertihabitans brevis]|uniref:General stress protein 17M-like domain-containing protein n=1 Tax=Desertihabitans brevis TaxID=2268447 RepID=A0A367YYK4_9ACTN|nr:general stress protein [Desertihabitans brevis]RCK70920.1 hypothetical protein DT076_00030 [Desertihabitans brevis]
MSLNQPSMGSLFKLKFPQSVRIYDEYAQAQKAVDFLADQKFAVENLAIVGTDLKSVERVTGRRTWGSVILRGVTAGISVGLLFGLLFMLFVPSPNALVVVLVAVLLGIVLNVVMQAVAYGLSGGRRDFESLSQTVATRYELMCEHKVAQQARELLDTMPGERARAFE